MLPNKQQYNARNTNSIGAKPLAISVFTKQWLLIRFSTTSLLLNNNNTLWIEMDRFPFEITEKLSTII